MDDRDEGADTYSSLTDLQAAAGDIEPAMPDTPETAAAERALRAQLAGQDAEILARDGPDMLTSARQLRQAALVAERDPGTVAHALLIARRQLVYDHAELARWFGIGPDQLAALGPEPQPDPSAPAFVDQVRRLAERFGADPDRLAETLA